MKNSLPHERVEQSPVTGIFILFLIATGAFALFLQDAMVLVFAIFIAGTWVLAVSRGGTEKGVEGDLATIGVTGKDIETAIPIGVIIGGVSLIIGSLIMSLSNTGSFIELSSIIIPGTATVAALGSATVIPSTLATTVTVLSQWFYIAPGEEAGFRVLTVFALESIIQNPIFSFFGATLIWAALHIPVWMTTGVSSVMYLIVIIWGIIWSAQFVIIRNYFSNVISHAVTNTGVIVASSTLSAPLIITLVSIVIVLIALGVWYAKN